MSNKVYVYYMLDGQQKSEEFTAELIKEYNKTYVDEYGAFNNAVTYARELKKHGVYGTKRVSNIEVRYMP